MFQENLKAIKIKNPTLAEKLEKIDINSITGIEVFEAESKDLIISYKNTLLHSAIDPVREAKTTWNRTVKAELKKNDIQIVFGLGLGYLFKRAYVNTNSKVFVLEPNIEVLRFVMEHVDFSGELSDNRVYITDNNEDILQKLLREFLSGDKVEFLFLNDFANANIELLKELTSKAFEIIGNRGSDESTVKTLCHFWADNFLLSISKYPDARPLGFFEEKFTNKTALIIAAGPSLNDDIEKIKTNKDKFVIFSVGRAFKTLIKSGIMPDFTVFADAVLCLEQIKGLEEYIEKSNLILLSKGDRFIYDLKSKSKIIYFSETDSISRIFQYENLKNPGLYKSGSSVSIISYYIAKIMGFSQIAFSGLDLAFIDNKLNSDQITSEEQSSQNQEFLKKRFVYVKDKNGNELPSRSDYALFIRQFNEIFTEEINLAKIINTSLKGAYIKGMEYMSFDDFAALLTESKPDVDEIISEVTSQTQNDWHAILEKVYERLTELKKQLENLALTTSELGTEYKKICDELNEKGNTEYNPDTYEQLKNKTVNVRKSILNDELITYFIQGHLWDYTKKYATNDNPNKEDLINNIKLENEFFNIINKNFVAFTKYLDKNLIVLEQKLKLMKK